MGMSVLRIMLLLLQFITTVGVAVTIGTTIVLFVPLLLLVMGFLLTVGGLLAGYGCDKIFGVGINSICI